MHGISGCSPLIASAFVSMHAGWALHPATARSTVDSLVADIATLSSPPTPPRATPPPRPDPQHFLPDALPGSVILNETPDIGELVGENLHPMHAWACFVH